LLGRPRWIEAERVIQETRGWVEERAATVTQRTKGGSTRLPLPPEPDLPPLFVDADWLSSLRARLRAPDARAAALPRRVRLRAYDAEQLSTDLAFAALFEQTVAAGADARRRPIGSRTTSLAWRLATARSMRAIWPS
jgi:aspartyl-tRNA(Asn)/glutamyl-tRNA(Gln) amidotransferase subunit B